MTRPPGAPAIGDYVLLGDTRSAALVSPTGDIDWWCLPRFDSSPVCGRLVGGPDAGHISLGPVSPVARPCSRNYLDGAPVLRTSWQHGPATLTLTEGMVSSVKGRLLPSTLLVRRLEATGGTVPARWAFAPRYGWATEPLRRRVTADGAILTSGPLAMQIRSFPPIPGGDADEGHVDVVPGRPLTVVVSAAYREPLAHVTAERAWQELEADIARWRTWTDTIPDDLPFREAAARSAMVLRLLTYSPTGAPVAAPTTSLPEQVGGSRNWDYRFTWPRDASIGVAAFLGLEMTGEAQMFLRWLLHASRLDRPRLPVVLTLDGRRVPAEVSLDGWPGYRQSAPVRTGNDARAQHQLDGYGWVVDAMHLFDQRCGPIDGESWRAVTAFADFVATHWQLPDAGIWEERSRPAHHTHSKMMAWLALDRAIELACTHPVTLTRLHRWTRARDEVATQIRRHGFNPTLGSYTRTLDGQDLDASVLVLPLLGIEPAGSPRVSSTIDAIRAHLRASGPYLYRYRPGDDGLPGSEGAFLPCSFWLVQALAATGRTRQAHQLMQQLVDASPLGLYSEEVNPVTDDALGNYPQALTHAALLQAVLALRAADRDRGHRDPAAVSHP